MRKPPCEISSWMLLKHKIKPSMRFSCILIAESMHGGKDVQKITCSHVQEEIMYIDFISYWKQHACRLLHSFHEFYRDKIMPVFFLTRHISGYVSIIFLRANGVGLLGFTILMFESLNIKPAFPTLWYGGSNNGRQGWCNFLLNEERFWTPKASKSQGSFNPRVPFLQVFELIRIWFIPDIRLIFQRNRGILLGRLVVRHTHLISCVLKGTT